MFIIGDLYGVNFGLNVFELDVRFTQWHRAFLRRTLWSISHYVYLFCQRLSTFSSRKWWKLLTLSKCFLLNRGVSEWIVECFVFLVLHFVFFVLFVFGTTGCIIELLVLVVLHHVLVLLCITFFGSDVLISCVISNVVSCVISCVISCDTLIALIVKVHALLFPLGSVTSVGCITFCCPRCIYCLEMLTLSDSVVECCTVFVLRVAYYWMSGWACL